MEKYVPIGSWRKTILDNSSFGTTSKIKSCTGRCRATCRLMSTPQVIMLAYPSLKHIRQGLVTFLRFIQRSGATSRKPYLGT